MKRLVLLGLASLSLTPSLAADPPGFWATLKNECPGAAVATVADRVCGVTIGTASFTRIVQSGEVPAGFTARINLCVNAEGKGVVQFSPTNPTLAPAFVEVKPDGTVAYPKGVCKK